MALPLAYTGGFIGILMIDNVWGVFRGRFLVGGPGVTALWMDFGRPGGGMLGDVGSLFSVGMTRWEVRSIDESLLGPF